jgi:hypothetical protein
MSKTYARIFDKGEIDFVGVEVKSIDPFDATLPTFEMRSCPDYTVIVPETAAAFVGPVAAVKKAIIQYNVDTSIPEVLPGEEYVLIFGLTIDGIRKRLKKLHIRVVGNPC